MFNSRMPNHDDLPSAQQLVSSTVKALIAAIFICVAIVLPAEYGVDPTGIGNLTGLKKMGEIKKTLADEAREQDKKKTAGTVATPSPTASATADTAQETGSLRAKKDSISGTIASNASVELKAVMSKGQKLNYTWETQGGPVNYSVHGESSDGKQGDDYAEGTGETKQSGSIEAKFDGTHGWFFRNRSDSEVTVTINVEGDFSELKQL